MRDPAQTRKAASIPTLRKYVALLKAEGFQRVCIRFDEYNRPYVDGRLADGQDELMANRIDAA